MLFNQTSSIGMVITGWTNDVTGSLFITLLILFVFVMLIAVIFRVSFDLMLMFGMPLILLLSIAVSQFMVAGILGIIYFAFLIGKFLFNR